MQKESQRHNDKGRAKTSLEKYSSHFIVTFACEREVETEHNCNILTPTLMAVSVVSFSFSRAAQPAAQRPTLPDAGFLHRILSPTGLQTPSGVPRAPSAGCGFPYHILSPTSLIPNSFGGPESPFGLVWLSLPHIVSKSVRSLTHWLPVFTELYNSSTSTQSPTQSLEWHVWSSSSGNNCDAVHRSLSSGASVYECIMGFLPCPISSAKSAHAISFDYWPLECVTSFRCITLEWHVFPDRRSIYNTRYDTELHLIVKLDLESVQYSVIAITPWYSLTRSDSPC